jgi:hypothetical protein
LEQRREKKLAAKIKADAQRQKAKEAKALEAEQEALRALDLKMRMEQEIKREEVAEEDKKLIKQEQQQQQQQQQQQHHHHHHQQQQQQQEDLDDMAKFLPKSLPPPLPLSPSPPSLPSLKVPPPSSLSLSAYDKTQATEESPKDGKAFNRYAKRNDVSPPCLLLPLSPNVKVIKAPEGQAVPPPPQTCISSGNASPPQARIQGTLYDGTHRFPCMQIHVYTPTN